MKSNNKSISGNFTLQNNGKYQNSVKLIHFISRVFWGLNIWDFFVILYLDGAQLVLPYGLVVQHRPEAAAYIFPKRPPPCPPWSIVVVVAKRPHEEEVPVRRQLQVSCMEILIIIGSFWGVFLDYWS